MSDRWRAVSPLVWTLSAVVLALLLVAFRLVTLAMGYASPTNAVGKLRVQAVRSMLCPLVMEVELMTTNAPDVPTAPAPVACHITLSSLSVTWKLPAVPVAAAVAVLGRLAAVATDGLAVVAFPNAGSLNVNVTNTVP
jgi:hypothetical protein